MLLLTLFSSSGVSAAVTSYPYAPDFNSDDGWTKSTKGNGSWSRSSGCWRSTFYSGTSDAYLFSPELLTESGNRYTFTFTLSANNSRYPNEKFTIMLLSGASATSTQLFAKDYELSSSEMTVTDSFSYDSSDGGSVYFCVYDKSDNSSTAYKLDFTSFKVEKTILETRPNAVTNLAAERGANQALTVALSWTNPVTYNTGETLTISRINLYRNSQLIKSLTDAASTAAGATVSLTDNVPASGYYDYEVEVVDANGKASGKASRRTAYVGPLAAIAPPYTLDFGNAEELAFWKTIDGDGTNNWSMKSDHMEIKVDGYKDNDDWFVSRPFDLDASKAYKLAFTTAYTNPRNLFNLDVMIGGEATAEAMTSQIVNVKSATDYTVVTERAFSPATTGTAYIGWHANNERLSSTYYSNTLSLSGVSIVEIPVLPGVATGVKATPAADGSLQVALEWTSPAVSETGLALGSLQAEVYRDGVLVKTVSTMGGAKGAFTDSESEGLTKGYHTYAIKIVNENGASAEAPASVESGYVGTPEEVPFASDFNNKSALWTIADESAATPKHSFTFADGKATVTETSGSNFNDWLITPPIAMKTGKTYKVTVNGRHTYYSSYYNAPMTIKLGKSNKPASLTESIGSASLTNTAKDYGYTFAVDADGVYSLGINIGSTSSSVTSVEISSVVIEEVPTIAKTVTGAYAKSVGEDLKVALQWTMPTESTLGKALTCQLTAKVTRDGSDDVIAAISDLEPGKEVAFTDENASTGINHYSIIVVTPTTDDAMGGDSEAVAIESDWTGKCKYVPFASDFVNEPGLWTVIDKSGLSNPEQFEFIDGHAQLFERNGKADASKDLTNTKPDDYLVSPAIKLESGRTYKVTVNAACGASSSSQRPFRIVYGVKNTAEALTGKITPASDPKLVGNTLTDYAYEFSVDESGKYFIGFYLPYSYTSYAAFIDVASIMLEETKTLPAEVTAATVEGNGIDNTATVKFTMPTVSDIGAELAETLSAAIYRDGATDPTATIGNLTAGQEVTYEDCNVADGYHTYKIAAVTTGSMGGEGNAVEVASSFIGAARMVPFESDFETASSLWTVIDDSSTKGHTFTFADGKATITEPNYYYTSFNDWLVTPPVRVVGGATYRISINAKVDTDKKTMRVMHGEEPTINALKSNVISSTDISTTDYGVIYCDWRPSADGITYFGIQLPSSAGNATEVSISDFDITIAPVTPKPVTGFSAEAQGTDMEVALTFTMPSESTMGDALTSALEAQIYRNGVKEYTLAGRAPGEVVTFSDTQIPEPGVYTYTVVAATAESIVSDAVSATTTWVGRGVTPPYDNAFDSESDLAGWTVASTYPYGTYNWTYDALNNRPYTRVGYQGGYNYWLFTMPLYLETKGIYDLTFDTGIDSSSATLEVYIGAEPSIDAMSTQIGEVYTLSSAVQTPDIMFSTNGNADASNPGDITSATGNYYIGFMMTNVGNNCKPYIDNLVLTPVVTSSTASTIANNVTVHLAGDMVEAIADSDVRAIEVYTMSGQMVASAVGTDKVCVAGLVAGVYAVKVTTDKITTTTKIIK